MKVAALLRTGAVSALLTLAAFLVPGVAIHAASLTVNSTGDAGDATPGDGVCETAFGNAICTLRAAIEEANALAGAATIGFAIPGGGPHTIQPTSALPTITEPVTIDGYTQPGASANTNDTTLGLNTVLTIELEGSLAGAGAMGLHFTAGSSTVRGLVINSFDRTGIVLQTNGSNAIEGNFIGTDVTGMMARGNTRHGVRIRDGASNNAIGGPTPGARNLISGNQRHGIRIADVGTTGNVVQGNLIGTDVTGTGALGNTLYGVRIGGGASNNRIGGSVVGERNVISGNGSHGVIISGDNNRVSGNYVGTDVAGTADLGNFGSGVNIQSGATGNVVGGSDAGAANVISGNGGNGVIIRGDNNRVSGNYIGTDFTGTVALGNSNPGVKIKDGASDNIIGGTTAGERNIISGNDNPGVVLRGSGTEHNVVSGNYIGTDVTGTVALGNARRGVEVDNGASNNTIGGTASGEGNTIAFNDGIGVLVESGTGNAVLGNAIFSNTDLGIDLGASGITPNDAGDSDTGPNNLQNFPELTFALPRGGGITIHGDLNSTPKTTFRLEFFANASCDPSGHGEGEAFIGFNEFTTNAVGNAVFTAVLPGPLPAGQFITATATDPDGNTSEFSECVEAGTPG